MTGNRFEYGAFSRGSYLALWSVAIPVALAFPNLFLYYVLALLAVGFGLRPLIEKTGLFELYQSLVMTYEDKRDKNYLADRRSELDRKARDEKYRKSRVKDPRLPPNW